MIGQGEIRILTPLQDARTEAIYREIVERPLRQLTNELAADRERYLRAVLEGRLPRWLHWIIDRPRALRWLLCVVPYRLRGDLAVVQLRRPEHLSPPAHMRDSPSLMSDRAAKQLAQTWLAEMGDKVPRGGVVFSYTDPMGLPAEVYGPIR